MEMEGCSLTSNLNGILSLNPTFHTISPSHISLPPKPHSRKLTPPLGGDDEDDTELSIFQAERYFNDIANDDDPIRNGRKKNTMVLEAITTNTRDSSVNASLHPTPTASSEASWNSRSGLLAAPRSPVPLPRQRRRRLFRRSCLCSGEKSVDVEEKQEPKASPDNPTHEMKIVAGAWLGDGGGFSFPVLAPPKRDPACSPEVFLLAHRRSAELRRRPSDEDAGSDTSSDLFEIESLSTCRRQDSLDGAGRFACYPPSEASVEWSVTTAEAANFSSAASDYEEFRFVQEEHDRFPAAAGGGGGRKGGGLLGCVSEKAVSVGPRPVRLAAQRPKVGAVFEPDRFVGVGTLGSGSGLAASYAVRMSRVVQTR